MPKNLNLTSVPVNSVIELCCDLCRRPRSRRSGHVVDIATGQHFVCAGCLNDLERDAHRDFLKAADLLGGAA